jgi:arylsulfatase A-like enzyme
VVELLWVIVVAFLCGGLVSCDSRVEERKNVVLVSIDALDRDSLELFRANEAEFPNFSRLMRSGLTFANAYSSASWTLPAHASLFSGLYPDRHGAIHPKQVMDRHAVTIAMLLEAAGYRTAAFTDGVFLDRRFGLGAGFERYDDRVEGSSKTQRGGRRIPRKGRPNPRPLLGRTLFDRGISFLSTRQDSPQQLLEPEDSPFFLFLHSYAVHDYFFLHPWATSLLPGLELKDTKHYLDCLRGVEPCSPADWEALEALYRAELPNLDEGLGKLLAVFDEKGLWDSTLLVFLSDHGEGFDFQNGRIHHGGRLHEDQIRIPVIVAGGGIEPGTVEQPISLVDIMPTLMEFLGLQAPEKLDGISFAPALRGRSTQGPRVLYAMEHYFWWEEGKRIGAEEVRKQELFVAVIKDADYYIRGQLGEELYDMEDDPKQRRSRTDLGAADLEELRGLSASRSVRRPERTAREQDEALEAQLRTLGYVE